MPNKILAVDTALGVCSVAVLAGDVVCAHRFVAMDRGHAEALAPMVQETMRDAGLSFADLDRLAVTTGPGTFTGQRVGLAFMRGLRLALKRPLVGITTLDAMAAAAMAEAKTSRAAVLHDARRDEVYMLATGEEGPLVPLQLATFEDAFAATKDIIERIDEFGGDVRRVGVAGDSAGGNLAAAVAIACRDEGIALAGQLLVYPVIDAAGNYADPTENARYPSRSENAEGYFLSRAVMEWFAGHYLEDTSHGTDWRASPLRAKNLAGVAPAIVATAWFDPLRDEGKAYAEALKAAGVATTYYDGPGLIHGYFGLGEASEAARKEAQRARADFRALLERVT